MSRIGIALSLALMLVPAATASAQSVEAATCTYETCAVRQALGFWSEQLVRGPDSERVLTISFTGANAVDFLSRVEAAAAPARGFRTKRRRALALGVLSGVALGQFYNNVGPEYSVESKDYVWVGVSLVSVILGGVENARARNDLSRAIWEFNRAPIR